MNLPTDNQLLPGIKTILTMFNTNRISYILFKCDHILAGQNKNVDIILETMVDFDQARRLLSQIGFKLRLSQKIEKYKEMWAGFIGNILYSIHLHQEVAWHGLKALDKQPLFKRAQVINPLVIIPSLEDSILIHAGHVLFENFVLTEKESRYLHQFKQKNINQKYIYRQLARNHWKLGFKRVLLGKKDFSVLEIVYYWSTKLILEPLTLLYLTKKMLKIPLRKLSFQRKGCLIALVGVNGSGKSTFSRKLLEYYRPTLDHLGKKGHHYYYGWNPTFPLTKWLSKINRQKSIVSFQSINVRSTKINQFDLIQEFLFVYHWGEYLYRYFKEIRPQLISGNLMITDRYFYDLFGQYNYSRKSLVLWLLIRLFPQPDFTYVLDANINLLVERKKTDQYCREINSLERQILPEDYLNKQRSSYLYLSKLLGAKVINTEGNITSLVNQVITRTWGRLL